MLVKHFFTLGIVTLGIIALSACGATSTGGSTRTNAPSPATPVATNEAQSNAGAVAMATVVPTTQPAPEASTQTTSATASEQVSPVETPTISSQVQNSGERVVTSVTINPASGSVAQVPGQSAPGAASGEPQAAPEATDGQSQPGEMVVYNDNTYQFRVNYPTNFVIRPESAAKLAEFQPKPTASFRFMNPTIAASDIVDLEPADLEIRVFDLGQAAALDDWLKSNSLASAGDNIQPFQTTQVSGVKVCSATMIAPGCSYFVLHNQQIFQLRPATLEGESMIKTFAPLS